MSDRWGWVTPATGVGFVVILVAGGLIGGNSPDPDASGQQLLAFYDENGGSWTAAALLGGFATAFLVFFGGYVRGVLRQGDADGGSLPSIALAGAAIAAVGLQLEAGFTFALASAPDEGLDPAGAETLNVLTEYAFFPLSVGAAVFGLAAGISALRTRALPRWLGWVAVVAGALFLTPAFVVAAPLLLLWIVVVGAMGIRASSSGPAVRAPAVQASCVALAAAAALGLAACGDDDSSDDESTVSKQEFVAQANGVCADGSRAIEREARELFASFEDGGEPSARQLERFGAEILLPGIREQVDAIDALPRPEGDEDEIDEIVALAREGLADGEQDPASLAAEDGGPPEISEAESRLVAYGVDRCGS
jgi:hypothetical protein